MKKTLSLIALSALFCAGVAGADPMKKHHDNTKLKPKTQGSHSYHVNDQNTPKTNRGVSKRNNPTTDPNKNQQPKHGPGQPG